jgi:hypothetical protein
MSGSVTPPAPAGRFVPPALVVLGVLTYVVSEQSSSDRLGFVLVLGFVVLPGALFFVCGYAAAYLLLRRRQRVGAWPRSGAAVVLLATLLGLACLAGIVSLFVAVEPGESAQTVTSAQADIEPEPPSSSPAATARPSPVTAAITRDGRPFTPNTVRIWRRGQALRLFASDRVRSCAEVIDEGQAYYDDETFLWIDIARQLQPNGVLGWRFVGLHVYFGEDRDGRDHARTIVVEGDGAAGDPTTVTVAAAARTNSSPTLGAGNGSIRELSVQGPITAIGCEIPAPAVPAQSGTMIVAGQRVPIVGAIVQQPAGDVVLSSAALDCEARAAAALTITLSPAREASRHIFVSGEWLRESLARSSSEADLPRASVRGSSRGQTKLVLSGSTVIEGYTIAIEGNVRAVRCR